MISGKYLGLSTRYVGFVATKRGRMALSGKAEN